MRGLAALRDGADHGPGRDRGANLRKSALGLFAVAGVGVADQRVARLCEDVTRAARVVPVVRDVLVRLNACVTGARAHS